MLLLFVVQIYLHGTNLQSLQKSVPANVLPDWLGGDLPVEECYDYAMEERAYDREDHYRKLAL